MNDVLHETGRWPRARGGLGTRPGALARFLPGPRIGDPVTDPVVGGDGLPESRVPGVGVLPITRADDLRGTLVAADFDRQLPFVPRRFFTVLGVPSAMVRGAHAHRACHQLLVCVQGSIHATVDDGTVRQEFVLDRPDLALHVPPMIWGTQSRYSADAVLLVLASDPYDPADYIRNRDEFLAEAARAAHRRGPVPAVPAAERTTRVG